MATDPPDFDGLLRKIRFLSGTFDEIDDWVRSGPRSSDSAAVRGLLGSLLARKRLTLETIEDHLQREETRAERQRPS